jgi:hypothetical protein
MIAADGVATEFRLAPWRPLAVATALSGRFPLDVFAFEPRSAPSEEWVVGLGDGATLTLQPT